MDIQKILNNPTRMTQLNNIISKHTNFKDVQDLVDPAHNYRLTLYFEDCQNNIQKLELKEIADFYDQWMVDNADPRRIYRIGEM